MKEKNEIFLFWAKDPFGKKTLYAEGEDSSFLCFKCGIPLPEGFICESNHLIVLCRKCQNSFSMARCFHDEKGEHSHLKFIRKQ